MNAREHAEHASALLDAARLDVLRLDGMDDDSRRTYVSDNIKRWCELAQAHATVALALVSTEDP